MKPVSALRSWAARLLRFGVPRLRAWLFFLFSGVRFLTIGRHAKIYGQEFMSLGAGIRVGDFCWIEAVARYGVGRYQPELVLGDATAMSDMVHISCVEKISIGRDCLIGSKVYIGDHSHGDLKMDTAERSMPPAIRPLGAISPIEIGERVWIGDGAVILAGTYIAKESIIGANSVVRLRVDRPALIAGVPAKVIRYFGDGADAQLGGTDSKDGSNDN